jgi:exopolysaccharide production protein ExoZ
MSFNLESHRVLSFGLPASIILLGTLEEERGMRLPNISFLESMGDASYSIYLWHLFATALVFRFFGFAWPIIFIAFFGGIIMGLVSYNLIEKPIETTLRRKFR